jgi:hypothetical protein
MKTMKKPYTFGKFLIPEPCLVPWEEMDRQEDKNRFCQQCKKVVHDISGMSPSQIEALEAKNGGNLCGAFFLNRPPLEKDPVKPSVYSLIPLWLKGTAAAAAFAIFLLQPPRAKAITSLPQQTWVNPGSGKPDSATVSPSFMLSSVVLDQNGNNIIDNILVKITLPNGEKREIETTAGFFVLHLEGLAKPEEQLEITVDAQKFEDYSGSRTYPKWNSTIVAGEAQNLKATLQVTYIYNRMMRGGIRRR